MPTPRDPISDRVCQRLNALAVKNGATKESLAAATGYNAVDIGRLLNVRVKHPAMVMLDTLARVFGVTLADLVAESVPPVTWKPGIQRAIVGLQLLPARDRAAVLRTIDSMQKAGSWQPGESE